MEGLRNTVNTVLRFDSFEPLILGRIFWADSPYFSAQSLCKAVARNWGPPKRQGVARHSNRILGRYDV